MSLSRELFSRAQKLIPGGVNSPVRAFQPYPFFTKCARGSRLFDVDGREYLDYCLAYGAMLLGHSNVSVLDAVNVQLEKGSLYGTPTEQEVELAEMVCNVVPSAEMIRLVSTGGEATMGAIRVARAYAGKKKFVKFEGCYHGAHDSVLVRAGSGATTFGAPDSAGVPEQATRNTIVIPYNDIDTFEAAVKVYKDDLAAVIVEPVLGNTGLVLPRTDFLKALREITEKYGIVLIFDEIITGFRLALGGAQEYFGVKPDLTTLGKVMGGGFPLAGICGQEEIMRLFTPCGKVYQAGTFSGNPVSVVAGLATLSFLMKEGPSFYKMMADKCRKIVKPLRDVAADSRVKLQVVGISSMFQVFFTQTSVTDYATVKTSDTKKFMRYHARLLQSGVFVPPSQFETCFLSLAHSDDELKETAERIVNAIGY